MSRVAVGRAHIAGRPPKPKTAKEVELARLLARNPKAVVHIDPAQGQAFSCPLGDGPAKLVGGGATFTEVTRPERTALTDYTGNPLIRVDVPVFFDGFYRNHAFPEGRDIEPHVDQILALTRGEDGEPPDNFIASGPMPYSGMRFVMELPDWLDGNRNSQGTLIRQALMLHLVEWVDPAVGITDKHRRAGLSSAKALERVITAHAGQTLLQIAAHYLGDSTLAAQVGKLNGIRDVRRPLKGGTQIKLPI